ncbi:unnamed protein product [Mesocestoides corti]|uniref:Proteasome assembly chaperone 2 n=1 Tax=Mesocestoides corti TaxID=53468 RepID=A0A0R3UP26_MESCO|nr:unnamed protein product [Mesocestoides corti]
MVLRCPGTAETSSVRRQGYSFIIACVGVGNVSQLCMDVLISTLMPTFTCYLDSPFIPPLVGPAPYSEIVSSPPLACSLELYDDISRQLSFLQVRAPVFSGCRSRFAADLVEFILTEGFSSVVLLSSSFAMTRKDRQLRGPPLQYAASMSASTEDIESLSSLGLSELLEEAVLDGDSVDKLSLNLLGSGVALPLFYALKKNQTISTFLLNTFTCDGDNRDDALFMAHALNSLLKAFPSDFPVSWKTPGNWRRLYGTAVDPLLY